MANQLEQKLKKLHPQDREVMMEQRNALAEQLEVIKRGDVGPAENLDQGAIKRQLEQKDRVLERDGKLVAKGVQKDRLSSRAKDIEEKIKSEMCTRNELWMKSGTMDSERAIQKQIAFEKKNGDLVREWQEIQSRLEPEDPMNCHVERIRPER